MSNDATSKDTKHNDFELTLDELETVSAGSGKSNTSRPQEFLMYTLTNVDLSHYSISAS